jgi:hypothetical protein
MHLRLLGEYRRLARNEYSRDPRLQEIAPFELSHVFSSSRGEPEMYYYIRRGD